MSLLDPIRGMRYAVKGELSLISIHIQLSSTDLSSRYSNDGRELRMSVSLGSTNERAGVFTIGNMNVKRNEMRRTDPNQ